MSVHITALEAERFKKIRAISLEPKPEGLTVIGGKNGQGKTSVLDAIVFALGGDRYRPSEAHKRGESLPPEININLSNGIVVTRKGKNGSLKVTDPSGLKGNQGVLDGMLEKLALDLPKFMQSSPKEKAEVLLHIVGAGDKIETLDAKEKDLYDKRRYAKTCLDKSRAVAGSVRLVEAPEDIESIQAIATEIQDATILKSERDRLNQKTIEINRNIEQAKEGLAGHEAAIVELKSKLDGFKKDIDSTNRAMSSIIVPDIEAMQERLCNAEKINDAVRSNQEYKKAQRELVQSESIHAQLEKDIYLVREERQSLLDGCAMPMPGLSVKDSELIYNESKWDCMSSADQLKVAASIVKCINPSCGFVLLDKLEQMDVDTMREFGEWAESEKLQIIATRVSTGDECSIIIEDGSVKSSG
jgi:hypothetical protein